MSNTPYLDKQIENLRYLVDKGQDYYLHELKELKRIKKNLVSKEKSIRKFAQWLIDAHYWSMSQDRKDKAISEYIDEHSLKPNDLQKG